MSYQNETVEDLFDEIKKLESEIITAATGLKSLGEREADAASRYEERKNTLLIELYSEESAKGIKRTETARQALYRLAYKQERLEKNLAANELKAERDYIDAMKSVLMAKMSRLRILENERKMNGQIQP